MPLTKRPFKMLGEEVGLWDRKKIEQESVAFFSFATIVGQEVGTMLHERGRALGKSKVQSLDAQSTVQFHIGSMCELVTNSEPQSPL